MKAKKLIGFLFLIVMTLTVCTVSASAACDCGAPLEWITTAQTCNTEGKRELTCTICKDVIRTEVIPAHNYKQVYVGKEATCTEEGSTTYFCTWCKQLKNEVTSVNPDNHSYGEWVIDLEPTCNATGKQHRNCTRCYVGREDADIPVDQTKHVYDETSQWTVIQQSDCNYEGKKSTECKACGLTFSVAIPMHSDASDGTLTGDAFTAKYRELEETPGTCSSAGAKNYRCQSCLEIVSVPTQIVPANHKYADWTIIKKATCTEKGERTKHCIYNYSHVITEEYLEEHDFSVEISFTPGADCTSSGKKLMKCANCDATTEITTDAEHIWNNWVITSGNCAEGGTAQRKCKCEAETETTTFAADTHLNYIVYAGGDIKPTCLYRGYKDVKCLDCNKDVRLYPDDYKATGHKSAGWTTTQEATCEKSGIMIETCANCGVQLEEKVVPQLVHNYLILIEGKEATCTETGLTPYLFCTICKNEVKQETIAATGHNLVPQVHNGSVSAYICDRCYQYEIKADDGSTVMCDCMCHNSDGIAGTLYRIVSFFNKLFGRNQYCECGVQHYEDTSIFEDFFAPILNLFNK